MNRHGPEFFVARNAQIVEMWRAGVHIDVIADRLGTTQSAIHTFVSRNRAKFKLAHRRRWLVTDEHPKLLEIAHLWAEGVVVRKIAEAIGETKSVVERIVWECRDSTDYFPSRMKSREARAHLLPTIAKMRMDGRTLKEIGVAVGVSMGNVSNMIAADRRNGGTLFPLNRRSLLELADEMARKWGEGLSVGRIASDLRIPYNSVISFIATQRAKHGLFPNRRRPRTPRQIAIWMATKCEQVSAGLSA